MITLHCSRPLRPQRIDPPLITLRKKIKPKRSSHFSQYTTGLLLQKKFICMRCSIFLSPPHHSPTFAHQHPRPRCRSSANTRSLPHCRRARASSLRVQRTLHACRMNPRHSDTRSIVVRGSDTSIVLATVNASTMHRTSSTSDETDRRMHALKNKLSQPHIER